MFAIFGRLNTSLQILLRVVLLVDASSRTISSRCKGTLCAVTHERVELQPHYSLFARALVGAPASATSKLTYY
jgi:hypothetical protein